MIKLFRVLCLAVLCALTGTFARAVEPYPMDELVVTATRIPALLSDLPANVSLVTAEEIKNSGARNASEALDRIEGMAVSVIGTLGSVGNVRIRGGGTGSSHVLVMVDGMPVNDVSLGGANLAEIPAQNIEKIEIVKGPVSSLYGANALGGVINIITKKPEKDKTSLEIKSEFGSFRTKNYNVLFSRQNDNVETVVDVGTDITGGWRMNSDYINTHLLLNMGYALKNSGKITLSGTYYGDEMGAPGQNATPVSGYDNYSERQTDYPDARQTDDKWQGYAKYESGTAYAKIYGRTEDRLYVDPVSTTDDFSETAIVGTEGQASFTSSLLAGADIHTESFSRTDRLTDTPDVTERIINGSVFGEKSFSKGNFKSSVGVRYDYHSVFKSQINPRWTFVFELSDTTKLCGNVGRAFRAPTFEDLYSPYTHWGPEGDSQGNEALKPESAWSFDIGMKHAQGDNLEGEIMLYKNSIRDLIQWSNISSDPNYTQWRPRNIGKVYNQGIELKLVHTIKKYLSQVFNYRWLDSKGKGEFDTGYTALIYAPEHNFNYTVDFKPRQGTDMYGNARYVTSQWTEMATELPPYLLLNLRISQEMGFVEIYMGIDNLLNTHYQTRYAYPLPGRSFSGGLGVKF